jgi:hypothetical protein
MKKLELCQMEKVQGGGRCESAAGTIMGFGLALLSAPVTPLNIAVGIVATSVGAIGATGCPWK